MIFVSLGTQKFQLNRLLKELDDLIENNLIKEEVFAQIGYSTYIPKNYPWTKFLSQSEFEEKINMCSVFISHGGVGAITSGLKLNKIIIIYPRKVEFDEHVDDHQLEISYKYKELGYCLCVDEKDSLLDCLNNRKNFVSTYKDNRCDGIENSIIHYLKNEFKDGE